MKVILLDHIEKLGRKGEVVSVKRGFARNYLIPRGFALYATPQNMKHLSAIQHQAAEEEEKLIAELKKLDAKIRTLSLVFVRKVDEHDNMFGSVSEADIVSRLLEEGVEVHKSAVIMEKNIKALGEHAVQIRLHRDIVSEIKLVVEKENKDQNDITEVAAETEEVTPEQEETEVLANELPEDDEL
jgi:large subunit ribosomal protein L9